MSAKHTKNKRLSSLGERWLAFPDSLETHTRARTQVVIQTKLFWGEWWGEARARWIFWCKKSATRCKVLVDWEKSQKTKDVSFVRSFWRLVRMNVHSFVRLVWLFVIFFSSLVCPSFLVSFFFLPFSFVSLSISFLSCFPSYCDFVAGWLAGWLPWPGWRYEFSRASEKAKANASTKDNKKKERKRQKTNHERLQNKIIDASIFMCVLNRFVVVGPVTCDTTHGAMPPLSPK